MLNVSRLIKGSIVAVAVVTGGVKAIAVVYNMRAPYAATGPELTNGAVQSAADRFRWEFAEWPRRPRRQRGHAMRTARNPLPTVSARSFVEWRDTRDRRRGLNLR
jgi:acyl-CoA reductase-like NAD-dependent aldehyde dehydrogenase